MPETSSGPSLTKASEPRRKPGRPPKSTTDPSPSNTALRPKGVTYQKHRKQEVLLWLINHRFEDIGGLRGEDAAAGVERLPHKLPDGTEKWFRGPTFAEAAHHWNIPLATIAHWWEIKESIFDGAVPSSIPPLVPASQRQPGAAPPPPPPAAAQHTIVAVPPSPTTMIYPQAVQPVGPPLHPLYRANFALGEVSREVAHMLQNQHNLYLENLMRAIALSQALVNDLTEAHQVLLSPESYPQYYPSAPPPQHHHQQQQVVSYYQPPPPPQPTGPLSRTPDGRYVVIQPAGYQAAPIPAPVPAPKPPPSQQAGEHRWLVGTGVGKGKSRPLNSPVTQAPPPTPLQQSAAGSDGEETSAARKRSYASKDGPGTTADQPIELEDDDGAERQREGADGREKRRHTLVKAGPSEDAAVAQCAGKVDTVKNTNGVQVATEEGSLPTSHAGSRGTSSAQHDGDVSSPDGDRESAAPTTDRFETTVIAQVTAAGEPKTLEGTAANNKKGQHGALSDGNKVPSQQNVTNDNTIQSAENGTHKEASADTATAPGSPADGKGFFAIDSAASSAVEDELGDDSDHAVAEAPDHGNTGGEVVDATISLAEDADMVDAPIEDTPAEAGDESSPVSVED